MRIKGVPFALGLILAVCCDCGRGMHPLFRGNPLDQRERGNPTRHRKAFTSEEDRYLRYLVEVTGTKDWRGIAQQMPKRRSDRQCRERWKNYLAPGLNQGPWTKAEDRLLVEKFRQFGPKWAQIILSFPHRSNIDVKNRWKGIKTLAEIEEPLGEVVRHSPSIVEEADDQPQETPAEFLDENFYWLGSP